MTSQPGRKVYKEYSQAELDAEYNNRDKVSDFDQHIAWYPATSASTRESLYCNLDIQYGGSDAETLDIFHCDLAGTQTGRGQSRGARPVHAFFHGGYWQALSKSDFSYVANGLSGTGSLCIVINYALIPAVDMDELVAQCRRALVWIWRNIDQYGGDKDNITISGHSAGGHLVAMMMATDWPQLDQHCPVSLVKGGIGISGLYDLEPIRLCYLNKVLGLDAQAAERNSPVRLTPPTQQLLVLVYGDEEGREYERQSTDLEKQWPNTRAQSMRNQNHFTIARDLNDPDSEMTTLVRSLL